MKHDLNASDWLRRLYPEEGMSKSFSREVTFQLGEDCTLRCTYCYQGCKSKKAMSWEVAKKCVDLLFKMYDDDDPEGFINKSTRQIILDFIGGEPLLYLDMMDKICAYFWDTAIKRRHVWAETFMISMASNGTLYFEPKVQEFFQKYKAHLSFSVSIDGPQEMHDACRVYPDGSGSFEIAKKAQDDFNTRFYHSAGTKATIARANLPYLGELIDYYVKQGYTQIHANYVYEEQWNYDDAKLLYEEMKELADYILNLDHEVEVSLFEENFFTPKSEDDLQCWCGGTGSMLAFDPDGIAYPCIRYMKSSLGDDQPPLTIGDCDIGIYNTDKDKATRELLEKVDRRTQSTDECFYCPIASGCSYCFKAGTLISTPSGQIPIENLRVGDEIICDDGSINKIYFINQHYSNIPIKLTFDDGTVLYTTRDHPIKVRNGEKYSWVEASDLQPSQIIVGSNHDYHLLTKSATGSEKFYDVYNISVENNPTYIANGIVVHNCSAWNYQLYGTPDSRCTYICPMHKARSLANVYYWNKKYLKENTNKNFHRYLSTDEALRIISRDEVNMLNELEWETYIKTVS